jgi:lipid-A-disaccharide synthase
MRELKNFDQEAKFRFWGGDLMLEQGGELVSHYRDRAFMGFVEVIKNVFKLLHLIRLCKADLLHWTPDVVIFVDYPGFNMRIAKFAKINGFKTFYYISPQVWAWKKNRVKNIKKYIDTLFVILPFEKEYFKNTWNYEVYFPGHPLLDAITEFKAENDFLSKHKLIDKPVLALMPGSRKQEINSMLFTMLKAAEIFSNEYYIAIALASSIDEEAVKKIIKESGVKNVKIIKNESYQLLNNAKAGIIKSGTSTLEAALFKLPQIVVYKTNPLNYFIARLFVNIKFISLVNLILNKEVVKELIQNEMSIKNIQEELKKVLTSEKRNIILEEYENLKNILGGKGCANRLAERMYEELVKSKSL